MSVALPVRSVRGRSVLPLGTVPFCGSMPSSQVFFEDKINEVGVVYIMRGEVLNESVGF